MLSALRLSTVHVTLSCLAAKVDRCDRDLQVGVRMWKCMATLCYAMQVAKHMVKDVIFSGLWHMDLPCMQCPTGMDDRRTHPAF